MSEIHESISVDVPFENVPELCKTYIGTLHANENGEAVIPLRVAVGNLVIERDAMLKVALVREYPGYEIMEIGWHAREGGPYPAFKGTLSAGQEGLSFCRLDLDGAYEPPGGLAGVAFDAVLGHRIAEETARELLRTLKHALEGAHKNGATS